MYSHRRTAFDGPLLTIVLLALSTASCSGTGPVDSAPVTAPAGLVREITPQERSLLFQADQILLRDCMARRGFRLWPAAENPVPEAREFPYVIDDIGWARSHGYGSDIQARIAGLRRSDPNVGYLRSLSPQRRAAAIAALNGNQIGGLEVTLPTGAVIGRSEGGCTSESERELYGDQRRWFRAKKVTESLVAMARARVINATEFGAAMRRWAGCMLQRGYRFSSPVETRQAFVRTPGSREQEIRLAVAEAACAAGTGFAAAAHSLEREYLSALHGQYRSVVATKNRLELAAVSTAKDVLRQPG